MAVRGKGLCTTRNFAIEGGTEQGGESRKGDLRAVINHSVHLALGRLGAGASGSDLIQCSVLTLTCKRRRGVNGEVHGPATHSR